MRDGNALSSVLAIDRLIVGRALRKRGAPAEAERYLMWSDAAVNTARDIMVQFALGSLVNYERGVALDEAGNRQQAVFRLRRFIDAYDQPPPQHRALVEDARRRLAQFEATDAPARSTVAPR